MKRVTNACIGGRNFTLNDDAYNRLDAYLRHFIPVSDTSITTLSVSSCTVKVI